MYPVVNLIGATYLTLGYDNSCWMDEVAIILTGVGPSCGTREFNFPTCVSFGNKEYAAVRNEPVQFEVEYEILKDSDGHFGYIKDS